VLSKNYIPHLSYVESIARKYHAMLLLLSYKPIMEDYENYIDLSAIRNYALAMVKKGLVVGIDSLTCGDCVQSEKLCVISSTGEVYPCSFIRHSMGNLTKRPIEDIWASRVRRVECPYKHVAA